MNSQILLLLPIFIVGDCLSHRKKTAAPKTDEHRKLLAYKALRIQFAIIILKMRFKYKKRNTVFLLISVNVSGIVKFTEIGSVEY